MIKYVQLMKPRLCIITGSCLIFFTGCGHINLIHSSSKKSTPQQQGSVIFSDNVELDYLANNAHYKLDINDKLNISVFQAKEFSGQYILDTDGNIHIPLLGKIKAYKKTTQQLNTLITAKLKENYLQSPQVTINLLSEKNQTITLDGEFRSPGLHNIKGKNINLLQAIAKGRGLSNIADPSRLVLFRENNGYIKAYQLDLNKIRSGKLRNPYLLDEDILIAYRSNARYWLQEVATVTGRVSSINRNVATFD